MGNETLQQTANSEKELIYGDFIESYLDTLEEELVVGEFNESFLDTPGEESVNRESKESYYIDTLKEVLKKRGVVEDLNEIKRILDSIDDEEIDKIVKRLFSAWEKGRTIFVMGNGGSASTATHFACDLSKCTIVEGKKRFKVISLNTNIPLMSALINDEGFDFLFTEQIKNLMEKEDFLVGFSVHGGTGMDKAGLWSQNLLKAMDLAKNGYEATLIGFSGNGGGAMKDIMKDKEKDCCLVIPSDKTEYVEPVHSVLEHVICKKLKEKIENYDKKPE